MGGGGVVDGGGVPNSVFNKIIHAYSSFGMRVILNQ